MVAEKTADGILDSAGSFGVEIGFKEKVRMRESTAEVILGRPIRG